MIEKKKMINEEDISYAQGGIDDLSWDADRCSCLVLHHMWVDFIYRRNKDWSTDTKEQRMMPIRNKEKIIVWYSVLEKLTQDVIEMERKMSIEILQKMRSE